MTAPVIQVENVSKRNRLGVIGTFLGRGQESESRMNTQLSIWSVVKAESYRLFLLNPDF